LFNQLSFVESLQDGPRQQENVWSFNHQSRTLRKLKALTSTINRLEYFSQ